MAQQEIEVRERAEQESMLDTSGSVGYQSQQQDMNYAAQNQEQGLIHAAQDQKAVDGQDQRPTITANVTSDQEPESTPMVPTNQDEK